MNINTDIDDFHIFFPLRLMGLGDSQNRKMAIQQTVRNAPAVLRSARQHPVEHRPLVAGVQGQHRVKPAAGSAL